MKTVEILGDSILKGIQLDPETEKYVVRNDIGLDALAAEYGLAVTNRSHFGSTAERGARLLERLLERGLACDAVVMDFGGNDSDFQWAEVAAHPEEEHPPAYSPEAFTDIYRAMVRKLKAHGILPVLTTLPPLEPQRFLDWWCRECDKETVLRWMGGSVSNIYAHQELYSKAVERLAAEESVPLADIRWEFLNNGHLDQVICMDGTHPNSAGQALIGRALRKTAAQLLG